MQIRKLSRRGRVFTAAGTVLGTLVGMVAVAPVANADVYTSYTLQVAAEGTRPVAPRFFEGFGNTINVAGSETAEYALEQVGALYNNAGIFGCNLNSGTNNDDKRTCNLGANAQTPIIADAVLPSTDIYDNFDHNVVNNAQAVGSAAGVSDLCNDTTSLQPTEPSSIPATWPYYTYPVVPGSGQTFGALGIPIDLVRASASIADLGTVGVSGCSDLLQQGIASDAVVGLSFNPAPSGVTVTQALPPGTILNFTSVGGANSETDTAWRVFCAPASSDLSITTWDQLAAVEGFTGPTPDQPIVLWGQEQLGHGGDVVHVLRLHERKPDGPRAFDPLDYRERRTTVVALRGAEQFAVDFSQHRRVPVVRDTNTRDDRQPPHRQLRWERYDRHGPRDLELVDR